jgi:hypothetical protein
MVHRNPDLIIAFNTNLVLDFKAATTTIPIVGVFALPVENGVVATDGSYEPGERTQRTQRTTPDMSAFVRETPI